MNTKQALTMVAATFIGSIMLSSNAMQFTMETIRPTFTEAQKKYLESREVNCTYAPMSLYGIDKNTTRIRSIIKSAPYNLMMTKEQKDTLISCFILPKGTEVITPELPMLTYERFDMLLKSQQEFLRLLIDHVQHNEMMDLHKENENVLAAAKSLIQCRLFKEFIGEHVLFPEDQGPVTLPRVASEKNLQ